MRVLLIILDGFGIGKHYEGNAIWKAQMDYYKNLLKKYPHSKLKASGTYVGLPRGFTGNSEVGHLHIGAGRIVEQPLTIINNAIKDGSFFKNQVLKRAFKNKHNVHVMGLCSDGGVHSHINHLCALAKMSKKKIYLHCFLDGRDVPEKSSKKYIEKIKKCKNIVLTSIIGRYYAMDRDNNWDRTQRAYDLIVKGKGKVVEKGEDMYKYINKAPSDYYVEPIKIKNTPNLKEKDSLIFFNFRTDRARQISKLMSKLDIYFVGFETYDKTIPMHTAFHHKKVKHNLGYIISKNNLTQLRVAETEKYAHVTYFFNSLREKPYKNEDRILIPSPKVPSYDEKPEMSAYEITDAVMKHLNYDFILVNYANPDLVGHSGNLNAVIKALEHIDKNLKKLIPLALSKNYVVMITADHGNAEQMLYDNGKPCPSHTRNPVPFLLIHKLFKNARLKNGSLIDIAPTVLYLLGLKKPKEMTGSNLIVFKENEIKTKQ